MDIKNPKRIRVRATCQCDQAESFFLETVERPGYEAYHDYNVPLLAEQFLMNLFQHGLITGKAVFRLERVNE